MCLLCCFIYYLGVYKVAKTLLGKYKIFSIFFLLALKPESGERGERLGPGKLREPTQNLYFHRILEYFQSVNLYLWKYQFLYFPLFRRSLKIFTPPPMCVFTWSEFVHLAKFLVTIVENIVNQHLIMMMPCFFFVFFLYPSFKIHNHIAIFILFWE